MTPYVRGFANHKLIRHPACKTATKTHKPTRCVAGWAVSVATTSPDTENVPILASSPAIGLVPMITCNAEQHEGGRPPGGLLL